MSVSVETQQINLTLESPGEIQVTLAAQQGPAGPTGTSWAPEFAIVADGARRVQQVVDWFGGDGDKPATGMYVGAEGFVENIEDAVDIRGPSGAAAGTFHFVHNQPTAAAEWTITHNAGIYPSVTVIDTDNKVIIGDIEYIDSNTVKVSFASAFAGKAYLN